MNNELESKILCREIGRLVGPIFGIGARWAAKRLPSVAYSEAADVVMPTEDLFKIASDLLKELGRTDPGLPKPSKSEAFAIFGSGIESKNPTIVHLAVSPGSFSSEINVRAVAKEGIVQQSSAELAVRRFMNTLSERLPSDAMRIRET